MASTAPLSSQAEWEVDKLLQRFADSLKASDDYIEEGVELCERVLTRLKKECSESPQLTFSIAEVHYTGSVGKRTDVINPDFDLVLKLHHDDPNSDDIQDLFKASLDFFMLALTRNAGSLKIKTPIKGNRYCVQFEFYNGMQVDLLPADASLSLQEVRDRIRQHQKSKDPSRWRISTFYGTTRVEEQISFMKKQSSFTHRLARITKYWFKSLDFGDVKVVGGSLICELLSAESVLSLKEAGWEGEPMLEAFCRVLENVANLKILKLGFKQNHEGDWELMTPMDTLSGGAGQVPKAHTAPYILEPGNVGNNILQGMSPLIMDTFMRFAREKLANLRGGGDTFDVFSLSFQQASSPALLSSMATLSISEVEAVAYVIHAFPPKAFLTNPGILDRSRKLPSAKMTIATTLMNSLIPVVAQHHSHAFDAPSKSAKRKRVKKFMATVRSTAKVHFPGLVNTQRQKFLKMKPFDAVVIVPFPTEEGPHCIMCGLGWSPSAVLSELDRTLFL